MEWIIALVVIVLIVVWTSAKIVQEYQRIVVFTLGRCTGARGPGFTFLVPLLERGVFADLREEWFDVPPQTCITKDNAPVSIDFLVYMKIVDPVPSVVQVQDYKGAARGIAITTLRAVVGDMALDEMLARRDEINRILREKLDEVTNRWGIKVTAVEIREIIPPQDIQEAMSRQMSAERTRRALVTEADGKREAAIMVAEGEKQAAILQAEGAKQGEVLRAEGYATALNRIYSAAQNIDSKTLSLQYLEALKVLGAGPSTKFVLPMEFTSLIRPFVDQIAKATQETSGR